MLNVKFSNLLWFSAVNAVGWLILAQVLINCAFHWAPPVLWHCWLGIGKSIQPVKIVMRCWRGCLERDADCLHMVQLMPLHPKTPSSLASFKSRLVLPFWYRLTQVDLEKRPLNGCSISSSSLSSSTLRMRLCSIWVYQTSTQQNWTEMCLPNTYLSGYLILDLIMSATLAMGKMQMCRFANVIP